MGVGAEGREHISQPWPAGRFGNCCCPREQPGLSTGRPAEEAEQGAPCPQEESCGWLGGARSWPEERGAGSRGSQHRPAAPPARECCCPAGSALLIGNKNEIALKNNTNSHALQEIRHQGFLRMCSQAIGAAARRVYHNRLHGDISVFHLQRYFRITATISIFDKS